MSSFPSPETAVAAVAPANPAADLEHVFAHAPLGMARLTPDGVICWTNQAFATVGAFPLSANSFDAALLRSIEGGRTLQVNGGVGGNVLVEAYDSASGNAIRFVNVSSRSHVGVGADILVAGFTVLGTAPKTVLVRAIGPALGAFGVPNVLADPKLEVYSGSNRINGNDNWPASLLATFAQVGAFQLPLLSKDSAIVLTLAPGGYTVQVSGADGGTGEGLVEIYEVQP